MSNDNNFNSLEEQRRRKAESFRLNISDNYDDDGVRGSSEPEEISSYSGEDVKHQIARESKRSLKKIRKEEKRELKARNRRNRRVFRIAWLVSVAIIGSAIAVFLITGMNDLLAINRKDDNATVTVDIPKDPTIDSVTEVLAKNGVIGEPDYFRMYATLTKSDTFSQGSYELTKNMDYQAIISNLQGNSRRTDTVEVTIIEGMSVVEIADKLVEEKALSDKEDFLRLCSSTDFDKDFDFLSDIKNNSERYYKLEGYLYPDKYEFYQNDDPKSIIYKLLNNYENRMYQKQDFGYDKLYSVHKVMDKFEKITVLTRL